MATRHPPRASAAAAVAASSRAARLAAVRCAHVARAVRSRCEWNAAAAQSSARRRSRRATAASSSPRGEEREAGSQADGLTLGEQTRNRRAGRVGRCTPYLSSEITPNSRLQ
jgi:hypothetical protein